MILAVERTGWPWVAVVGGLLLLAGGGTAAMRGARWPVGRRYEAPSGAARGSRERTGQRHDAADRAPVGDPPGAPAAFWDALDRGEDPTAAGGGASTGSTGVPPRVAFDRRADLDPPTRAHEEGDGR